MKSIENYSSYQKIKSSPSFKKVATIIVLTLLLAFIVLMFVPWQQSVSGSGSVMAFSPTERQQNISAAISGRLGEWYVQEGSHVKKGDPIVKILDLDPRLLQRLQAEEEAVKLKIAASEKTVEAAERNVKRHKTLLDKGLESERSYDLATIEHLNYLQDLANSKVELAQLKVEIARQQSRLIKAPMSGTIVNRISGESSVIVSPGQTIATLVPDTSSRVVRIFLKGNDVALVHKGDPVMIHFEGWPAIQFSGWPEIAVGTFKGKVSFISPQENDMGMLEVFVSPMHDNAWPSADYLRQGVRANAWVMLNRVPLGYELWRRYNGFPPNLNNPVLTSHIQATQTQ